MATASLKMLQNEINQLRNDNLATRLIIQYHIAPWHGAGIIIVINLVTSMILGLMTNTLYPVNDAHGFLNDYSTWSFEFVFHPTIIGGFIWLQYSITHLFEQLLIKEKIVTSANSFPLIQELRERLHSKKIHIFALFISLVSGIFTILAFTGYVYNPSWLNRNEILAWSRAPIYAIIIYAMIIVLYNIFITFSTLDKLFRKNIRIKIFHPDRVGGTGAVGRFVANLGYLMGSVGVTFTVSSLYDVDTIVSLKNLLFILYDLAYIILTPMVIAIPLLSMHRGMKKFKDEIILRMAQNIDNLISSATSVPVKNKRNKLITSQLIETEKIIDLIVTNCPTWPINFGSASKFLSLSLPPLLSTTISLIFRFS